MNSINGNLEVSDFVFSISGGSNLLASTNPSSINKSGNKYYLGLSLNGNPTGNEQITISPYSSTSIYDLNGNAAALQQSNNVVTLIEQNNPIITGVAISADNDFLTVYFNEPVFTNINSDNLLASDFILTMTNGYSSLAYNTTQYAVNSDLSSFILGVLVEDCDGNEILTVNPVDSIQYLIVINYQLHQSV